MHLKLTTGIHICIFSSTIYFAHRDCKKHDIRTPLWMYACVWVMFVLGTVHIVGNLGFQRKIWLHIVQTDQSLAEWRASNEENFFNILTKTGIAPSFWIQNAVLVSVKGPMTELFLTNHSDTTFIRNLLYIPT